MCWSWVGVVGGPFPRMASARGQASWIALTPIATCAEQCPAASSSLDGSGMSKEQHMPAVCVSIPG